MLEKNVKIINFKTTFGDFDGIPLEENPKQNTIVIKVTKPISKDFETFVGQGAVLVLKKKEILCQNFI